MLLSDLWVGFILLGGAVAATLSRKLTPPAAATGAVLGFLIYKGGSYTGLAMLAAFFLLGTGATGWGLRQKQKAGIAEERGGRRTTGQVVANAGMAAVAGLLAWILPQKEALFQLMIAGSFSAATADTLSSELGNLYGHRFYNVLTLKKDQRGLNGVISLEGTLCGVVGSIFIAAIYVTACGWSSVFFGLIIAGTIGNFTDSLLGATVERKGWLGNNTVNFLNTLAGAFFCVALKHF